MKRSILKISNIKKFKNRTSQELINAIAGYDGETAKKYAEANEFTKFVLDNVAKGDLESIKKRFSKDDYDFYITSLVEQYADFKKNLGELKEINVQGTTSFPWDANVYRISVLLLFEKGSMDLFLGY